MGCSGLLFLLMSVLVNCVLLFYQRLHKDFHKLPLFSTVSPPWHRCHWGQLTLCCEGLSCPWQDVRHVWLPPARCQFRARLQSWQPDCFVLYQSHQSLSIFLVFYKNQLLVLLILTLYLFSISVVFALYYFILLSLSLTCYSFLNPWNRTLIYAF